MQRREALQVLVLGGRLVQIQTLEVRQPPKRAGLRHDAARADDLDRRQTLHLFERHQATGRDHPAGAGAQGRVHISAFLPRNHHAALHVCPVHKASEALRSHACLSGTSL